jgi:hypothetical protein
MPVEKRPEFQENLMKLLLRRAMICRILQFSSGAALCIAMAAIGV